MNKSQEKIYLAASILLLIIGLLCDYLVSKGIVVKTTPHLPTISITLIQVQACLSTLIIAIIALLSGFITKSYLGIPICKYYLDIRPSIFKFKTVLLIEFLLISLSVIGQIFELYNFVILIFFSAILIIVAFIFQLYGTFRGENDNIEEIKIYFKNLVEKDNNYKKIGDLFIRDWKKTVSAETLDEFKCNTDLFIFLIKKIILKNYDIHTVNSFLENISLFLLKEDNIYARRKGVIFVYTIYKEISNLILNKEYIKLINKFTYSINLINCVRREWWHAINELDKETIQVNLNYIFFVNVLALSAYFRSNKNIGHNDDSIYIIANSLGYLRNSLNSKNCVISTEWWKCLVNNFDKDVYSDLIESCNSSDIYLNSKALLNFNICAGFLRTNNCNLVKTTVFLDLLHIIDIKAQNCPNKVFKSYIFQILLVHCYAYYLAFRESSEIVGTTIQEENKALLTNKEVIKNIITLCYTLGQHPNILNKDLENELENVLEAYECSPVNSHFKSCIMNNVIRDYFLYLVLISDKYEYSNKHLQLKELDTEKYCVYLSKNEYNYRNERFSTLSTIFGITPSKQKEMFRNFDLYFQKEFKDKIIIDSIEEQKKFNSGGVHNKIKTMVVDTFNDYFNKLNTPSQNIKIYPPFFVGKVNDYTKFLNEEINSVYREVPWAKFMKFIVDKLNSDFNVKKMNRIKDFKTDSDFINFLKNGQYDTLIGEHSVFSCKDPSNHDNYLAYNKFMNEKNTIFIPYSDFGIITRNGALYLKLNDVNVDISSPSISELSIQDYKFNSTTGLYEYNIGFDIPLNFDTTEFSTLIQNERKIIKIYFNVSIGTDEYIEKNNSIIILENE